MKSLIIGNVYPKIECESFKDPETGRIRVRPVTGQDVPENIVIECSSTERKAHPLGTRFITEKVKVCKKPDGRIYLRAKDQRITKLE